MLRGPDGRQAKELDRLAEYLSGMGRIDAVLLSDALLAGLAGPLRQSLRAPVACMLQDEDEWLDYLPEPYRRQCWEELARRATDIDAFIAVSRYYADLMAERLKASAGRIAVIHSALDLRGYEEAQSPPATPIIGFLSRLCRHKGLELLVEAMEILRGRFPNVRLRAAGGCIADDKPFLRQLRRRLKKHGLAAQVEWLPNLERSARQEFLRSLSVMCVPSLRPEAFGRYIIEALACGVPVAAVDHGAAGEILGATGGGLLVAPNDPAALAAGLGAILGDRLAAHELGLAGSQVVRERFSDAHMARTMAALLGAISERVKTHA
jgi:glycosyltransferase involved in cell wall biosynthesis